MDFIVQYFIKKKLFMLFLLLLFFFYKLPETRHLKLSIIYELLPVPLWSLNADLWSNQQTTCYEIYSELAAGIRSLCEMEHNSMSKYKGIYYQNNSVSRTKHKVHCE